MWAAPALRMLLLLLLNWDWAKKLNDWWCHYISTLQLCARMHTLLHIHIREQLRVGFCCLQSIINLECISTVTPLLPIAPSQANSGYVSIQMADGVSVSEVLTCKINGAFSFRFPIHVLLTSCIMHCCTTRLTVSEWSAEAQWPSMQSATETT